MPKRWERELERLNDLNAPASTRARIASGPHGDGPDPAPNRRQRVIAGAVAFAVFAIALAFAAKAFGGRTTSPAAAPDPAAVVFTFSTESQAGSSYPDATLNFQGAVVEGNGSTYSWTEGNFHQIADTFGTELQFDNWVVLPAGAPIQIDGSADSVHGWVDRAAQNYQEPSRLYEIPSAGGHVPEDAGKYVLEFSAQWPQGERTFYFPIRAVDSEDVGASLVLEANPHPTASLSYKGVVAPAETGAYCWGNGQSPTCSDGNAGPFSKDQYLEIPQGTALNVYPSQEANSYSVALYIGDDPVHQTGPAVSVDGRFDSPGSYLLILTGTWQQGDVQFFFPIRVVGVEAHPVQSSEAPPTEAGPTSSDAVPTISPTPAGDAPTAVPDMVGLGDQAAIWRLTQAGFHVQTLFRDVPGDEWRVVSSDPAPGTLVDPGSRVTLMVVSRITPLPAGATDALDCDPSAFVPFGSPHVAITPAGSAFIAGNTAGIKPGDDVVSLDPNGEGLWHVVRDWSVIAIVDYQTLDGVACAGSGVAGA